MVLYHYTKLLWVTSILRHLALWPSPPLRVYGLSREEVERAPARFGFREGRSHARRFYSNNDVPHPDHPGILSGACWFEGQVFDVALTRADWCYSALSYFPRDLQEGGLIWRLVVETDGLDLAGWRDYQRRANVPGDFRRMLADRSRRVGDDPNDWYFFFGELPLAGRIVELEQYHRGRWTRSADVFERAPLAEIPNKRRQFEATFTRVGHVPGLLGASLFTGVYQDGRLVADHLWVHQTWNHLAPGDNCQFFATVVPYTRRDGTAGWTLSDVNCLVVLSHQG
jgi:hypothetical protein